MTSVSSARTALSGAASILGDVAWQPSDYRLWPVIEQLAGGQFKLLSCDFFDTLLWRVTPHPSDAFPFVYHRLRAQGALAPHVTIQAFDSARKLAEEKARKELAKICNSGEVTLKEIYRKIPREFVVGLDPDGLAAVEERAEHELLRRDESFVRLLGWARRFRIPFVVVSDTFYSSQALLGMMEAAGWPKELAPLRVFASSEARRGKTQGLMARVAETMGVGAAHILHVGDNPDSDVHGPGESGIRGVLVERIPQSAQAVEAVEPKRDARQRGASLSEHADFGLPAARRRLAFEAAIRCPNEALRPYWTYGALVFGPALAALGQWMRVKASALGNARKIYCLQREGEFFCRLLAALEKSWPAAGNIAPMQTFSLPASRLAMMKCVVKGDNVDSLISFAGGLPVGAKISVLLAHLGIGDEPLGGFETMKDLLIVAAARSDLELLCRYIAGSERLSLRINELARRRRERFVGIALEGDSQAQAGDPFVLADLGYNGTIQKYIAEIFRRAGASRRVMGLYMVTNAKIIASQMEGSGPACGYLADAGKPLGFASIDLRNHPILEQALMPNMGSVVDFGEDGPVRQTLAISPAQQSQQEAVQEGILACADVWPRMCRELGLSFDPDDEALKSRLRAIAERAMGEPTQDELNILGGWHHEINLGSSHTAPLAGQAERYVATRYASLFGNFQDSDLWLSAKLRQADVDAHDRVLNIMRAAGEHRFIAASARERLSVDLFAYLEGELADGEGSLRQGNWKKAGAPALQILNGGEGVQAVVNEQGLFQAQGLFSISPRRVFRSLVVKFAPIDGLLRLDGAELLWAREISASQQMLSYRHLADGSMAFAGGHEALTVEGEKPVTGQLYSARKGLTARVAVPASVGGVAVMALNLYLGFVKDRETGFDRWAAMSGGCVGQPSVAQASLPTQF